jgi:peptide/nickel transport system substrate-binding protein
MLAAIAVAVSVAGCGGSTVASQSPGETLRLAFSYDPGSLDPDVFMNGEGMSVVQAAYEGLVQYRGDSSTEIDPLLATSWDISPDRLTYTFHLRDGVKFHDGTAMDSASWKAEFERRKALDLATVYLVNDVENIETPDPLTLVLKLSHPNSAFLHYLASPYGIRAVSSKALADNTVDGDHAQKWLATHTAGTGAYQLGTVSPGQSYQLKRFDGYWGQPAGFPTVHYSMVPNFTTQQLTLEQGQLDVIYHGVPFRDLKRFTEPKFQIQMLPSIVRLNAWINPAKEPFTSEAVRQVIAQAVDRKAIVDQVYGDTATVATNIFPAGVLPEGKGAFNPAYDPSKLKALVATLPSKKVDLAYTTDDALNAQVAQLLQTQLSAAGLEVTTRGVTQETTWAWPTQDQGRPNILILPANSDHADPSAWPTVFYSRTGGLSYFAPTNVADADQLIVDGLRAESESAALQKYVAAADRYTSSGNYLPLADQQAVIVARSGLCGWEHDFTTMWALRLPPIKPC